MKVIEQDYRTVYGFNLIGNGELSEISIGDTVIINPSSVFWKQRFSNEIMMEVAEVMLKRTCDKVKYLGVSTRTYYRQKRKYYDGIKQD